MLSFKINNKVLVYIGVMIFVISLIMNISFIVGKDNLTTKVYKGTYICKDNEQDPIYIVLTSEGEYYKYKQYDTVEQSDYIIEDNGKILLSESNRSNVLLLVDDRIYSINTENNQVDIFDKESSSLMFINVQK